MVKGTLAMGAGQVRIRVIIYLLRPPASPPISGRGTVNVRVRYRGDIMVRVEEEGLYS